MKTKSYQISGTDEAIKVVTKLIVFYSAWFEVTPYPDDIYKITVRADAKAISSWLSGLACCSAWFYGG